MKKYLPVICRNSMPEIAPFKLNEENLPFFRFLISESPEWQKEETEEEGLQDYMRSYQMIGGEWLVWKEADAPIGISYHAEWVPSNEKAWLGTLLLHPDCRNRGYGKKIIQAIAVNLKQAGHKVLFAACPEEQDNWTQFLCHCGFEQLKREIAQSGKYFLILILPL
ncbi:GNAT family N-acetyltransferase [Metabacillus sp. GX 13764]|uniref:GNAT family N-acetyltransferase n=1 Tax=Metabacillus kandeliae TaxID=2900151 RepID=UPI001E59DE8B|nr:GNAT family N-acetyltransferase [Metabacillus kandeliae]MCD7033950.1 GNAT family N-acetyltransferase [Metabacillus kandeliae]